MIQFSIFFNNPVFKLIFAHLELTAFNVVWYIKTVHTKIIEDEIKIFYHDIKVITLQNINLEGFCCILLKSSMLHFIFRLFIILNGHLVGFSFFSFVRNWLGWSLYLTIWCQPPKFWWELGDFRRTIEFFFLLFYFNYIRC